MAKWKLSKDIDKQIDAALKRASRLEDMLRLLEVRYIPSIDALEFNMSDGRRHIFPRENFQGLENATKKQLSNMVILGPGSAIDWPDLDVQVGVEATLKGIYGSQKWMAALGQKGGSVTSPAKAKAARANGAKGGRPKRKAA